MFRLTLLLLTTIISLAAFAMPYDDRWKPELSDSHCTLVTMTSIPIKDNLEYDLYVLIGYLGDSHEFTELQERAKFSKNEHGIIIQTRKRKIKKSDQTTFPTWEELEMEHVELFIEDTKLTLIETEKMHTVHFLQGQKFDSFFNRLLKSKKLSLHIVDSSGKKFTSKAKMKQFDIASKMYLTCTENIT